MADSTPRWLSISDAARVARLGESTIYRRIKAGQLPARAGDAGATMVDAQAVRALARLPRSATTSTKTASGSAASGGGGDGGGGGGNGTAEPRIRDGELAARVFQALEAGSRPVDLVTQLQAPPADVAALVRAWQDLRSTEGNTLADRVGVLEAQVATLEATLAAIARAVPPADARCPQCERGALGMMLQCVACGTQAVCPPAPAPAAAS